MLPISTRYPCMSLQSLETIEKILK